MTWRTLIQRTFRHHLRSHLGTVAGAAIGSAVLCGALIVGDSVRHSLRKMALERLGSAELALATGDRFVRDRLAIDLQERLKAPVLPLLQLVGTAANTDGLERANRVQIVGVTPAFWQLSGDEGMPEASDAIVVNAELAARLKLEPSDTVLLRVPKPSLLSRDVPLASDKDSSVALRVKVAGVVSDAGMGRFSLQANQVPPLNAFVPLRLLQERLDLAAKANLLLVGQAQGTSGSVNKESAQKALQSAWTLDDAELEVKPAFNPAQAELRSRRVFLDQPAVASIGPNMPHSRILTYFVNDLRHGTNATPYSMVSAVESSSGLVPAGLKKDEIVVNSWLASDLAAQPGDSITLTYYVMRTQGRLDQKTNTFRVHSVVPLEGAFADRTLMPDFPGLAKAESSHDWDTGFPIDLARIREKDDRYWKEHRGTPKAFVTLDAGQTMWSNRFGNLTAVRFQTNALATGQSNSNSIARTLLQGIDPRDFGLTFIPVRAQALAASSQAQDFSSLFLGFSFFIIAAALLLMALLFQFGLEQRTREIGTYLALGFRPRQIRRLLLGEGAALALVGSAVGVACGVGYARAMLLGLTTLWRDAVGTSSLDFYVTPRALILGLLSSVIVSTLTLWITLRGQARRAPHELLAQGEERELGASPKTRRWRVAPAVAVLAFVFGLALLGYGIKQRQEGAAESFFGSGALLLVAGLAGLSVLFTKLARSQAASAPTVTSMGIRASTRLRKRSLATVALLASGSFLIVAVAAHRLNSEQNSDKRNSGTGGFALVGESTLALVHDLNDRAGREHFGLDEEKFRDANVVSFRMKPGDDASCLNLNRAQTPTLLGVDSAKLAEKGAFTFQKTMAGETGKSPWLLLQDIRDGEIPAVGDAASIRWALKKNIGDTLDYVDERGRIFKIKLVGAVANSILQGSLLIDEAALLSRYPSESGYRMFLIDAPSKNVDALATELSRGLQDYGFEATRATKRLAAFNAVQNTYLNTFQLLGGLGLLLGSAGLGIVVLRNVLERRGELGVLKAIGFRASTLRWLIFSEHCALLALGLGLGVVAAGIAILPGFFVPGAELPSRSVILALAAVFASGLLWTWLAARFALRGELLDALRNN